MRRNDIMALIKCPKCGCPINKIETEQDRVNVS